MVKWMTLVLLTFGAVVPSAHADDKQRLKEALAEIQLARESLNRSEEIILELLMKTDGIIRCIYTTKSTPVKIFNGAGKTEQIARMNLVADCKMSSLNKQICEDLLHAAAVTCQ